MIEALKSKSAPGPDLVTRHFGRVDAGGDRGRGWEDGSHPENRGLDLDHH